MLVISRELNESFTVDGPAKVYALGVQRDRVKIGIEADKAVTILRTELTGTVKVSTGAVGNGESSA